MDQNRGPRGLAAAGIVAAVLMALAIVASNASAVIIREANGHTLGATLQRGVTPPTASATSSSASHAAATAQASTTWNGTLGYFGGPVFHSSTPYLIYWTPSGESIPTSSKNLFQRWMTDTAADSGKSDDAFGVIRQYYDTGGFADYKQTFSTSSNMIVDTQPYPTRDTTNCPDVKTTGTYPYPYCITDAQLATELARLVQANGLPTDGSASASTFAANAPLYNFVLPNNVNVCFPFGSGYRCGDNWFCSYHANTTNSNNQELIYTLEATLPDYLQPKSCQTDGISTVQEPNGDPADVAIDGLAHEYAEATTDGEFDGWNFNGAEVDGACASYAATSNPSQRQSPYAYAPTLGGSASAGTLYDDLINGDKYYTESLWSNGNLSCELKPASGTISASFTDTAPVQPGTAVSFIPSASSSSNGYSSTTWNWGDGTSSFSGGSGPSTVTHTYSSAGSYTATLTLVDTAGNVSTKSQSVVIGTLPIVTTGSSSSVGTTTATIAGTVNPNGRPTTYEFDYATAAQYAPQNPPASQYTSQSPASPGSAGSGTSAVNESANLITLQPGTTYHYRIEATNSAGTSYGSDQTFTPGALPPTVSTGSSSGVGSSSASIAGTANPNGASTSYEFDYATAAQYAPQNPPASQYTSQSPASPGSAGSGTSAVNESANLTSLQPNTTYHYRIEATNSSGTSYGSDQTFTTSSATTTLAASPSSVSAGGSVTVSFSGIVNPTTQDWIGLYHPGDAASSYISWVYTSSCTTTAGSTAAASGSCKFTIPTTGTYELRVFSNNSYTLLATSNPVTASGGATLAASPSSVSAGGSVTVSFSGIVNPTTQDWIGLYHPGDAASSYISWVYTSSCTTTAGSTAAASGSCKFTIPTTGTYELRVFSNNSYTLLATSNPVTAN